MKKLIFVICFGLITIGMVNAQEVSANRIKQYNLEKQDVAIQGYDPVSYFNGKSPDEGDVKYAYTYTGITYLFSSKENKNTFIRNPKNYEPAYGGWCAYAMGINGEKVKIDPETYKIIKGKLNLFYNFGFTNTLKSWNRGEEKLLKQAIINWGKIIK